MLLRDDEARSPRVARVRVDRLAIGYLRYVVPPGVLVAFLYGWFAHTLVSGAVLAFFALWLLLLLLVVIVGLAYLLVTSGRVVTAVGRALVRPPAPRAPRRLEPDGDGGVSPPSEVARGVIRLLAPASSPLSHTPCAVFRIVGEGPLGPIDDGGGVAFEVVAEDGEVFRVDPHPACVELDVADAPAPVIRPDDDLARFLTRRGVFPERGPVRLREAVLMDGDPVSILGVVEPLREEDGYRESRTVRLIRERPGAPLVIRRPSRSV